MENLKIAHFIFDEKFPDSAYEHFEAVAHECNDYYMANKPKKLKYIKKIPVKFINMFSYKSRSFIEKLEAYDFVVLHSLAGFNAQLVAHTMNTNIKYIWIGMGYDYYDLIYENGEDLLLDMTREIFEKYGVVEKNLSFDLFKKVAKKIIHKQISKENIISRIDYFSPVLSVEYELIKEKLFKNSSINFPRYVLWNYGVNARLLDKLNSPMINREENGILLGNSATYTNNHIEMLEFLKDYKDSFSTILCPLSYGNEQYADEIENVGIKYYGDRFFSLREFVPYDEYLELISKSSVVIMNHVRQQGGGNVSAMLYKGATVFLREENPLYLFYKDLGLVLFSIQELEKNPDLLNRRLSNEEIMANRNRMKSFGGTKAVLSKTKDLIEIVSSMDI